MKYTLVILMIIGSHLYSKQIPGSGFGVQNTSSNGTYFALETDLALNIYDVEGDSLVNSFGVLLPYSISNSHFNTYENGDIVKHDIVTGEEITRFTVGDRINNEIIKQMVTFWDSSFLVETNKSVYLFEDIQSGYKTQFLFKLSTDFKSSRGGKGVYYSDGKIYHIDRKFKLHSFDFIFEKDINDFNFRNGHLIYNYSEFGEFYLESYNSDNNKKKRIEHRPTYNINFVGNTLVTYADVGWRDLAIMSFNLELEFVLDVETLRPIDHLTEIDNNRLGVSSSQNSRSMLIDLDNNTQSRINLHSSTVQAFAFSESARYIATISSPLDEFLGDYLFQVINVDNKKVLFEHYYDSFNFIEEIFYTDEYGFVFQSGDKELSYVNLEGTFTLNQLMETDKNITSFNINDDYIYTGHENEFIYYESNSTVKIGTLETGGTVNLIRYNDKYSIIISTKDNNSTIIRMVNSDYNIDSISTPLNFRLGQDVAPKVGIVENIFYQIMKNGQMFILRLDQDELLENRSINAEKFGAVIALNDSIFICSTVEEYQSIKKIKIDYNNSSYEVLEEYPLNLSYFNYYGSGDREIPISRLVVDDKNIAFATYIDNTIRIIEDESIISSVEKYEKIDIHRLRSQLKNALIEVNIFDISGRLVAKGSDFEKLMADLDRNIPYILNYNYDKKNYTFKLIK